MRILMTSDCLGGVFVYALELSRALLARDVDVVLATTGRALNAQQRRALRELPKLEVHESQLRVEWMDDAWQDVAETGRWLFELAERIQPDCIHLNEFAHGALPFSAPTVMVGHSCVLSWWEAVHKGEPLPAKYKRYRDVVRSGLQAAGDVVAPSRAMLEALLQHYGPLDRACTIPNGIDLGAFGPRSKQPWILCAGRLWDEAKNLQSLQRAAAALPWRVCVAGETEGPNGAGSQWRRDRERAGCRMLGNLTRPELATRLGQAAIYALPARYEPFGLSVLEAAASGCALVLGRVPSLLENWQDAACFVDPDDPDALQHALLGLIADSPRRIQLGERARLRARGYGIAPMADAYLQLYRTACAGQLTRESVRCAS